MAIFKIGSYRVFLLEILLLCSMFTYPVIAQNHNWTGGAGNGLWNDGGNWDTPAPPGGGTNRTIFFTGVGENIDPTGSNPFFLAQFGSNTPYIIGNGLLEFTAWPNGFYPGVMIQNINSADHIINADILTAVNGTPIWFFSEAGSGGSIRFNGDVDIRSSLGLWISGPADFYFSGGMSANAPNGANMNLKFIDTWIGNNINDRFEGTVFFESDITNATTGVNPTFGTNKSASLNHESGEMVFQNGGMANKLINFHVAEGKGSNTGGNALAFTENIEATLTVDGAASQITTIGHYENNCFIDRNYISEVGINGKGFLNIINEGTVTVGTDFSLGVFVTAGNFFQNTPPTFQPGGEGTVTIDGPNSNMYIEGHTHIGEGNSLAHIFVSNNGNLELNGDWAKCTLLQETVLGSTNSLLEISNGGIVEGAAQIVHKAGIIRGDGGLLQNNISLEGGTFGDTYDNSQVLTLEGQISGSGAYVQNGGQTVLTFDDQITTNNFQLNNGVFNTGGYSGSGGDFTLGGDVIIDLGDGSSVWNWNDFSGAGSIQVWNWSGNGTSDGGNNGGKGTDQIIFTPGSWTGHLDKITFYSDAGVTNQTLLNGGQNYQLSSGEVVPGSDNTPPVIDCSGLPTPGPFSCLADVDAAYDLTTFEAANGTVNDADDSGPKPLQNGLDRNTFSVDEVIVNNGCIDTIIRTYSIQDLADARAECTHILIAHDQLAPVFDDPFINSSTYECIDDAQNATYAPVTATDNCSNNTITASASTIDFSNVDPCNDRLEIIYTAEDACLNSDTIIRLIYIADTTRPVIDTNQISDGDKLLSVNSGNFPDGDGSFLEAAGVVGNLCSNENYAVTFGNANLISGANTCSETWERVYTVADGCGLTDQFTQTILVGNIDLIPQLSLSKSELCFGETAIISAEFEGGLSDQVTNDMLSWSTGDNNTDTTNITNFSDLPGRFEVTLTIDPSSLGCPELITEKVEIIFYDKPEDRISDPACADEDNKVVIPANLFGAGIRYNWIPGQGVNLENETEMVVTAELTGTTQSEVILILTNEAGCSSDSIVVPVKRGAHFNINSLGPQLGCKPLPVRMSASSTEETDLSYSWTILGSDYGTTADGVTIDALIDSVGVHDIKVVATSPTSGCTTTEVSVGAINVLPVPVADLDAAFTTLVSETPIANLSNNSQHANLYVWDFGEFVDQELVTTNKDAVEYRYSSGGSFLVSLTAINTADTSGCISIDTATIMVKPLITSRPNVIRPSSSIEQNATFLPLSEVDAINPDSYIFHVFNRWGNRIFETTDILEPWTAIRKNGRTVAQGTYVYRIKFEDIQGNPHEIAGTLMVLD